MAKSIQESHKIEHVDFLSLLRHLGQQGLVSENLNTEIPIEEEIIDKVMKILIYEAPYAESGFILEGFPRYKEEINTVFKKGYFVDAMIVFRADVNLIVRRAAQDYIRDNPDMDKSDIDPEDENCPLGVLKMDAMTLAEKEIEAIQEIMESADTFPIDYIEVESQKSTRLLVFQILNSFAKYIKNRKDLFVQAAPVSQKHASELLSSGLKSLSEFGYICPVSLMERKLVTASIIGHIPIVLNQHVYYLRSQKQAKLFCSGPSYYLDNGLLVPYFPPRILVSGSLKCKEKIAEKIALELGIPVLHYAQGLEKVFLEPAFKKFHNVLIKGGKISDEEIRESLDLLLLRFPLGCVYEGVDTSATLNPSLIVHSLVNEEYLISGKSQAEIEYSLLMHEVSESKLKNILTDLENYDGVLYFDCSSSSWYISWNAVKQIKETVWKLGKFLLSRIQEKPFSAYRVGINKKTQILGNSKNYCCVSLFHHNNDLCKSWEFSSFYKDKVYLMCSKEHQESFELDPEKYTLIKFPDNIPQKAQIQNLEDAEFTGYCPVNLLRDSIVDGKLEHALEYKKKVFVMADLESEQEFMHSPEKYEKQHKKLPIRPPKVPMHELMMQDYVRYYIAETLNSGLEEISKIRPKLPFKSIGDSALMYLGVYLKASNPKAKPFMRQKWQNRLREMKQEVDLLFFLHEPTQELMNKFFNKG